MGQEFWNYSQIVWGLAWEQSKGDVRFIIVGALIVVFSGIAVYWHRRTFDGEAIAWTLIISAITIAVIFSFCIWRASHQTHLAQRKEVQDNYRLYLEEADKVKDLQQAHRASNTMLMQLGVPEKDLPMPRFHKSTTHEN